MLRENSITSELVAGWPTQTEGGRAVSVATARTANVSPGEMSGVTAVEIDHALRTLAQRRASLDVEEARWLRLAEECDVWPQLGYVHAHEYLEDVFGYAPKTATERLRVAKDLGDLPELEDALEAGELNFSIVRELTRVATGETVDRWLDAARGRNLRDVERMVSGRRKGDDPDTAPDPKLVKHGVWLDLDAESFALYRQARAALNDEMGERLDDKAFIAEVSQRLLSEPSHGSETSDCADPGAKKSAKAGRRSHAPSRMIHNFKCTDCGRAWQDGAGVRVELSPEALALAECDAIIVDDDTGSRARSALPPARRRKVFARDEERCQVPGCRSACNLDIHHICEQQDGGGHDLWNLVVLCGGHHRLRHRGLLMITGRAPDELLFERRGRKLIGPSSEPRDLLPVSPTGSSHPHRRSPESNGSSASAHVADAITALKTMGYKLAIAKRAVERACAHVGATTDLTALIREALRHCD